MMRFFGQRGGGEVAPSSPEQEGLISPRSPERGFESAGDESDEGASLLPANDADRQRAMELKERLLPWGFEQRVATVLNFFKVPLIIVVMLLGTVVERKINEATITSWKRASWFEQCFVHQIDMEKWESESGDLYQIQQNVTNKIKDFFEHSFAANNTVCPLQEDGTTFKCERHVFGTLELERTYYCDIQVPETKGGECSADGGDSKLVVDDYERGIRWHIPGVPHSFMWGVFKLLFLPVFPLDLLALRLSKEDPPPEPVFKLLTSPGFSSAKVQTALAPVIVVFRYIRYILLPNMLIMPLLTMEVPPKCEDWLIYKFAGRLGQIVYVWLVFDITKTMLIYALGKTVGKSRLVGHWPYRFYKAFWFGVCWIPIWFFVLEQLFISDFNVWHMWRGLRISLDIRLSFNFNWAFDVSFVKMLGSVMVTLDVLNLLVVIGGFIIGKACKGRASSL